MRFYFELFGPDVHVPDEAGVEATSLDEVLQELRAVVRKMHEDGNEPETWAQSEVRIFDEGRMLVFTGELGTISLGLDLGCYRGFPGLSELPD